MIGIRNKLKIVNSKMQPKLADIKETILTIISLALLRLNYCMGPLSTAVAFAKKTTKKKSGGSSSGGSGSGAGTGGSYKPDAPQVDSTGTVKLNGANGNIFDQFGQFLNNSHPIIGITIAAFGVLIIVGAVYYAYKGSRDISKGESTGFSSVGFAVGGAIIFGAIVVFAGIAVSMGINTGKKIFGVN